MYQSKSPSFFSLKEVISVRDVTAGQLAEVHESLNKVDVKLILHKYSIYRISGETKITKKKLKEEEKMLKVPESSGTQKLIRHMKKLPAIKMNKRSQQNPLILPWNICT